MAPAKLVPYLKDRSSRRLQDEFGDLWARGYFCASVGAVDEDTIKKYIDSQRWDDDDEGFKITAASLEPAVSREPFRRLQPQPGFQSETNSTGFSR
jgi:putative transposase